eukprot:TRINITY_DN1018_c0_g2_i1.p1 TRINITY_DN1018_c0_g2~~TRINITY_DN1018_c0_g2_i1.p1  ORF type:complete len:613 (+),score=220.92 TRINITY_DN1018_c0_g2_i1:103-1941(+)
MATYSARSQVSVACQYASEGDLDGLKSLENSVDFSLGDYDNRTPLMLAATSGHQHIVDYLLSRNVDVSVIDRWGTTALNCAIKFDNTSIIEILKKDTADKIKVSLWNSENDDVSTILVHDFTHVRRGGSSISSSAYGATATDQQVKKGKSIFDTIRKNGAQIISIHDAILVNSTKAEMQDFVEDQLICETGDDSITYDEIQHHRKTVAENMSHEQLSYGITHKITLKLGRSADGSVSTKSYGVEPVLDLLTRRYQIVTPKGVVLVGAEHYKHSTNILKFCFKKLGLPIILSLPDPLRMCGSDYIPAGINLSFIGTGVKTNEASVRYLLQKDALGTSRVAMVRDIFQRSPDHCLDRIMKIISSKCILISQEVIGKDNINRRLVTEYVRRGRKDYVNTRADVELSEYLTSLGYHLIVVPGEFHEERVYNAGRGRLNVSSQALANIITQSPHFKGTVEVTEDLNVLDERILEHSFLTFRKPAGGSHISSPIPDLSKITRVWDCDSTAVPHQTTNTVLMVAPVGFQTNAETAMDNFFMKKADDPAEQIEHNALVEFSGVHRALTEAGVQVVLFTSERFHGTPDAVFPNNWFTTHAASEVSRSHCRVLSNEDSIAQS